MAFHYPGVEPPQYGRFVEMLPVAQEVLRQSGVKPGTRVAVYTDTKRNRDQVDAFFAAATIIGAEVTIVMGTPRGNSGRQPLSVALAAMREASVVLDLTSIGWAYTSEFSDLIVNGTSILSCMANVDTCVRLPPHAPYARVTQASAALLTEASDIQICSSSGTSLFFAKADRKGNAQDGILNQNPDWDNFPSYTCACAPLEETGEGTLVIDRGDLILQLKRVVAEPISCRIKGGRIVGLEGGADARMLQQWFDKWKDPRSLTVAHIGYGCDPRAETEGVELLECESFAGGLVIAFGQNDSIFLGGSNAARSHIDIVLLRSDFATDSHVLVREGSIQDCVMKRADIAKSTAD